MQDLSEAVTAALQLIGSLNPDLLEIVALSLQVSLTAVAIAGLIGLPLGAVVAVARFPGRTVVITLINALMGLPPVVVGLFVYMLLSNSGPFGVLQLLYTPTAMIIAQTILVTPIVAALARQTIEDLKVEYDEQLRVLGRSPLQQTATLLWEGRRSLLTALLAGFGRAIAEVGAVLIVGGNINHLTRTMTTAIVLETSKGDLSLALGLGFILLTLAFMANAIVMLGGGVRAYRKREAGF
jgi:tungstate transport system permease protein